MAAGSDTAKAIEHAFKRWPALQRYANSGGLPIGKNPVENLVRAIAMGKKNWRFACVEPASYRVAAIQSLFATAELNELNPAYLLAATLNKLFTCPNSQVDSLLPFAPELRWKVGRLAPYRSNV
jgi:transposase